MGIYNGEPSGLLIVLLIIYLLSFLACLLLARYVSQDDWKHYPYGGKGEILFLCTIGFVPLVNSLVIAYLLVKFIDDDE